MPSPTRIRLAICAVLLVAYLGVVLAITMWPTPLDQGYGAAIERLLDVLHRHGIPEWFGYNKLEFTANILLFVPLGFLLALTLPEGAWWMVLLLIPAFSGLIEFTQGRYLDARFATVFDVVANTLGGYIGGTLAYGLRALVHIRDDLVIAHAYPSDQ